MNPTVHQRVYEMQPGTRKECQARRKIGNLDLPDRLELTEQLASSIPGARREIIVGAAHMVSMEQPQEFNRIVLDFLRKV